jgi:hypothetical protein
MRAGTWWSVDAVGGGRDHVGAGPPWPPAAAATGGVDGQCGRPATASSAWHQVPAAGPPRRTNRPASD